MRLVCSTALAALAALPACEFGPEGTAPRSEVPDAGKGCPLPAPDGCSEEECFSRGGCSSFSCNEASGTWQEIICESPPAAIDGRWTLFRAVQVDPCPEITRVDPLELVARPALGGGEAITSLDGSELSLGEVGLGFGSTQVRFGFDEHWSEGDVSLPVRVDYDLHFSISGSIDGEATATVALGERTCAYALRVSGNRE